MGITGILFALFSVWHSICFYLSSAKSNRSPSQEGLPLSERYKVMHKNLGKRVKVRLLREYGPYLDGRPSVPAGTIAMGVVEGVDIFSGEAVDYEITDTEGRSYSLQPEDVEILSDCVAKHKISGIYK